MYVVCGSERFLVERAVRDLRQKYVDPAMEAFSLDIISEKEKDITRLINSVQMLPTFSASRLVLIYEPFFLKSAKAGSAEDEDSAAEAVEEIPGLDAAAEQLLFDSLTNIPDGVTAAFVLSKSPDKRKKFFKFLQKQAVIQEFESFKPWQTNDASEWLLRELRSRKVSVDKMTTDFLVEVCGVSRGALMNEAEKLLVYTADKNKLDLQDAQSMVGQGELDTYYLGEAIQQKNIPKIMGLTMSLYENNVSPQLLLGKITAQVRRLLQIKELQASGKYKEEIARIIGQHPYTVGITMGHLPKYTLAQLKNTFYELQNADYQLKTGQAAPADALICALTSLV
ncbi:DNA polymerase III subunit delta [Candidatus Termititenax spirochaetophilus]|uniref:DNA polymerase III subunit delta n=1 Tax=Candidatus Termititenax spirochaetophilus TaxID=2218522 RepID=A0A388T7R9_9BACT|nr:DNA polymerase III subunit delta [Candidatus Termititenax spirochaetophilus]